MTATGGTLRGYQVDHLCNTISSIYQYCFGVRLFVPVQTGLGAGPASYTLGTGSLSGVKRPGHRDDNLPPYSPMVKESVDLYSPSRPLWSVLW
jgi:hypothetical protein